MHPKTKQNLSQGHFEEYYDVKSFKVPQHLNHMNILKNVFMWSRVSSRFLPTTI